VADDVDAGDDDSTPLGAAGSLGIGVKQLE
jgi:hypothetical protein